MEENKELEVTESVVEEKESTKDKVEKKLQKQIQKSREKREGRSRILEYLSTEHKWENYLFLVISIVTLVLGALILTGALAVKDTFPVIGEHPKVFAWVLIVISALGVLYACYPFFKPAFPEFKKISWLPGRKFLGNSLRVFIFLTIFALLFLLYDAFITQLLANIIK